MASDSLVSTANTNASGGSFAHSRLFRRLFAIALPGLIPLLIFTLLPWLALSQRSFQPKAINESARTVQTAEALSRDVDDLGRLLDSMIAPEQTYNPVIYYTARAHLQADTQALRQTAVEALPDVNAADKALRRNDLVTKLDTLLTDLNTLNTTMGRDPRAGADQWATVFPRLRATGDAATSLAQLWSANTQTQVQAADTFLGNGRLLVGVLSLVGLIGSLLAAGWVTQRTLRPVVRLRDHMARAARGDLRHLLIAPTNPNADELGTLERDYQHTLDTLAPLIRQIQEDATQISSSAAEISAAATEQASGSSEQAAAITEVTVTVEQLNQTAVQIAEAAASVAAAAEQALISANRGQEAVRDSILGMAMIKNRVNDITARILALSDQSQRIGEVIDVINTIAARTHILALNAAVESAGAGEQGQRFGVVAAEVKKLAQRSVAATKEVRALVNEIQAATAAAVMATEEGLKETDRGVSLAHQSGDANEDIISMVERTAQLANAISLATQQQRTASEQVVATMREVADVTRQAAVSSRQAAGAANQLSTIAGELRAASQGFRVGEDGPPRMEGSTPGSDPAPRLGLPLERSMMAGDTL